MDTSRISGLCFVHRRAGPLDTPGARPVKAGRSSAVASARAGTTMDVLLVSIFKAGALAGSYRIALESVGCNVHCFDFAREPVSNRTLDRLRKWPLLGYLLDERVVTALNYALSYRLTEIKPAVLLTINAHFALPGTLATAQSFGCLTATLWVDPLLQLNQPNIVAALPFYDCVFAFSESVCPVLKRVGVTWVEVLPLAWDPVLHPLIRCLSPADRERYRADILFVGKWSPERERVLETLAGYNLAIWGDTSWQMARRNSTVWKSWRGRPLRGLEYAKACAAAKICVNIVEPAAIQTANMRTFELTGMGRFMVAPRNADHLALFVEGEEIACYSTPEELRDCVESYLLRKDERERIGQAAHRKVAACHTYAHRAARLCEVLREYRHGRR